jgi:hypothetical protein
VPSLNKAWYCFIIAIPASCIIAVVFTSLWWSLKYRFLAVSALVWAIAVGVYVTFPLTTLVFAIAAVLQVLTILWFIFQRQLRKIEKELFSHNERRRRV